jgi:hypothetical protein
VSTRARRRATPAQTTLTLLLAAAALESGSCGAGLPEPAITPSPPRFFVTCDSDAWVDASLRVQRSYARVLAVTAGAPPARVRVRRLDLNARHPSTDELDLPVDRAFHTLQEAADAARGGDLVAVLPGRYAGFVVRDKPDACDDRYVHFKALGKPGEVTIDRPTPADGARWMVLLQAAHHVVVEGFEIAGVGQPGVDAPGPWAGIMLDGDFGRSGKLTHHVAVVGNFSHNHRNWGLHSTDTHTVLLQDNLFAFSAREHSAYVSDGSDDYVIRRNVFFGSHAGGLQVNLDPEASLDEVMKHPTFRAHPRSDGTRAWALGVIREATERFGENGFPDGRGVDFIIEENVMQGNGRHGGGALNLAGLQDSLIQNNLLYGNFAHGIAQWDNDNPFDRAAAEAAPSRPEEVGGPSSFSLWGCHGNVVRNNTVVMANPDRAAFQAIRGSWGSVVYNNVLINDAPSSFEVDGSGVYRLDAGANVVNTVSLTGHAEALAPLAVSLPDGPRTTLGVTRRLLAAEVRRAGDTPWVVIEGHWWRLNPDRPDFHPLPGSPLLAGRADGAHLPSFDLEGEPRRTADIGAFSAR